MSIIFYIVSLPILYFFMGGFTLNFMKLDSEGDPNPQEILATILFWPILLAVFLGVKFSSYLFKKINQKKCEPDFKMLPRKRKKN